MRHIHHELLIRQNPLERLSQLTVVVDQQDGLEFDGVRKALRSVLLKPRLHTFGGSSPYAKQEGSASMACNVLNLCARKFVMNEERRYSVSLSFLSIFITTTAVSAYMLSVLRKLITVIASGH